MMIMGMAPSIMAIASDASAASADITTGIVAVIMASTRWLRDLKVCNSFARIDLV